MSVFVCVIVSSYSYMEVTSKDFSGKDSFAIQGRERWFVNFTKIQRFLYVTRHITWH